ncbi:MAG: LytR/AlgR family response regulator transcription factor [Terriglobales bacterium]
MRVLLIDDEDLPRQILREYCAAEGDLEVAGEAADGFAAVRAVAEFRPQLIFLDVQMPKLDGFEVLQLLAAGPEPVPAVIFTTAFDEYALRAFDAHAVDYLLKPFSQERFAAAVTRARQRLTGSAAPAAAAAEALAAARPLARLVVRDGAQITLISLAELLAAEAQDDYVALHTPAKAHLKKQTLSSLEAQLDPARFVRVHRGWLLNLAAVARLERMGAESFVAILRNGLRVPVSRAGHARLRQLLRS